MAQTWIFVFGFALAQCSALVYPRQPFVPPGGVHLYLEEEPADVLEFAPQPPVKIYPLSLEEKERLYSKMWKTFLKFEKYVSGSKFKPRSKPSYGKKCCGGFYEGHKPVVLPGYGYPTNQVEKYRNSQVKPVVEHIEGDLKYDFRTNTHY